MNRIAIALIAALSVTGAACGGEGEPGGTPTGGGQTLSPGELPTSSPGGATGTVSEGKASVQVAGDLEAEFTSELAAPAIYSPPPGAFVLRWVEGSNGVGITGPTFTGSRPTSAGLALTISLDSGSGTAFFTSVGDECTITIDAAEATSIAGSFACSGLTSSDGMATVDASGRFSASA